MTTARLPSPSHWPRSLLWSAIAILSTVTAFPVPAAEPESVVASTLAGVWKLDVEKSDSAQDKMEAMRRSGGRGPRGGMGGGTRGGGKRGGMGGGKPPRGPGEGSGEGDRERQRGPEMRLMMRPPASMLIEQTDSTVVLYERGLPIEVLVIGLPQDKAGTVDPEVPHITASWSGNRLLALREDERGARATQQFALSADDRTFTLTVRREPRDDMPPLELKREYRREDGD